MSAANPLKAARAAHNLRSSAVRRAYDEPVSVLNPEHDHYDVWPGFVSVGGVMVTQRYCDTVRDKQCRADDGWDGP